MNEPLVGSTLKKRQHYVITNLLSFASFFLIIFDDVLRAADVARSHMKTKRIREMGQVIRRVKTETLTGKTLGKTGRGRQGIVCWKLQQLCSNSWPICKIL